MYPQTADGSRFSVGWWEDTEGSFTSATATLSLCVQFVTRSVCAAAFGPDFNPWHGFRVSGFGVPARTGFWVSELRRGLGFGFRVLGTAGGRILESDLSKKTGKFVMERGKIAFFLQSSVLPKKLPAEHLHISGTSDSDVGVVFG